MKKLQYLPKIRFWVLFLFSIITFFLTESLYGRNWILHYKDMPWYVYVTNILFYYLVNLLLFSLIGKMHWALILSTLCFCTLGLVQMYVIKFRTVPITAFDLLTLQTAINVANNYDLTLEPSSIQTLLLVFCTLCMEFFCKADFVITPSPLKYKAILKRGVCSIAFITILTAYTWLVTSAGFFSFIHLNKTGFRADLILQSQGVAYNFAVSLSNIKIRKPQGYNAAAEEMLLKTYSAEKNGQQKQPNIIVIMNEAFSDLSVLGDFQCNIDYMPFMHKMLRGEIDNTITGYMDVSIRGGSTSKTEYEFLTGNTCGFFPEGGIPYQFYMKNNTPSLASFLKNQGYTTIGMHPYNGSGWNRITVYPQLGFENSFFFEDFTDHPYADYSDPKTVRIYISDEADYTVLKEKYEAAISENPVFIFNVTMQNHGGYTGEHPNFTPTCKISGMDDSAVETYFSLLQLSDKAIEELLSYFSNRDEEVIVAFFGDHQPGAGIVDAIMESNNKHTSQFDGIELRKLYQVPFFIWSNRDLKSQTNVEISAN
ncbi:MAG TPA: sulfatase [Lachnospiraceae bacterium]|nr:sulfatase [Lachnospiraceae bacterium]